MDGDDPITNVARGWRRPAHAAASALLTPGVCAAVWREAGEAVQEVGASPNRATHSLAFTAAALRAEASVDGRPLLDGTAPPGACNLVQPGQAPRGVFHGPWTVLHVYLPDALLRQVVDEEARRPAASGLEVVNPGWTVQPRLSRLAAEVAEELAAGRPFGRLKLDGLGLALAAELLRGGSTAGPPRPVRPDALARWRLRRACDVMEARLDGDLSLGELADAVGLSPAHFSRAFKAAVGRAPFHWLAERRIARAKVLLEGGDATLAEVALACGYSAQSAFTTAFRTATGRTPGAWRRERRR